METDNRREKDKINQPEVDKNENDHYPKEFEEQRNENIRMEPQPLGQSKKDEE